MDPTVAPDDLPNPARRLLLGGFVAVYVASRIPWALAQQLAGADMAPFQALSALLAGRQSLDTAQAQQLYAALVADDPHFAGNAKSLLDIIEQRQLDPLALQHILDGENSPLAGIPKQVMRAWYLGIVGTGDQARCVAFETALNAEVVADVLKPPTYAYGAYGSWTGKPT